MTAPPNLKPTLGELFDLPDYVRSDDFVLRLTEAILRPDLTIKDYVVTDQLRGCFDEALTLVKDAVTGRRSTGAYLHGSFGTGKSHFMAVLYLLLSNDTRARSLPDLAEVVAKHEWTAGKKFLLVPYHMIGAETVEERVLGGYLDRIRELHPDAVPPGLYDADAMVGSARKLRQQFGDEAFFRALNQSVSNDGWGDAARWDDRSFEAAAKADPRSRDRAELIGALAHTLITGARHTVATVDLDTGLSIMSQHAKSLGYDAVILFLDEMILWLASRAASPEWITREGPKLAKLVESGNANRPAPIVSFVARQRAIRDLIGKAGLGASQALVEEALEWWEKRFSTITLEDRNLATIARRRLLKPKSEAARQLIEAEFAGINRLGNSVIDTVITSKSDREQFRELYPFTPALIEILVAVASSLQRERTVLNIMAQILVQARNRMRLGELVPVGELFVEMRDGYDPFGSSLKQQFDNARKLWERKLRPLIEADAGASYDDLAKLPADDPKARQLRAHERIAGTLILAGLAPELEPLRALTGPRLAALNYGSLRPFIPGTEGRDALALCRRWATSVGEIRISPGAESQASISVQLTSVDIESILENAKSEDSHGNRLLKLTDLFFKEMDLDSARQYPLQYKLTWRGTPRSCEISILNVREAGERELAPTGDDWHLVIDLPIDRENYTPSDDLAQLRRVESKLREPLRTLVWLPAFLSDRTRTELGRYAVLDYLLKGEKLREFTQHLSAIEREEARAVMDSMKRELDVRLRAAIRAAYGVGKPESGVLDESNPLDVAEQFYSLHRDLQLQPPAGDRLADSACRLVRQALSFEFPGHPEFNEDDVKLGRRYIDLAYAEVLGALRDPEGRKATEKEVRKQIRPLLEPLRLAQVTEQNTVPLREWHDHFDRKEAQYGGPVTVDKLRDWMNEPKRMGLPKDLQDLIILVYATQSNRSFRDAYGPAADPGIGRLRDEWKLEQQELPAQDAWDDARARAGRLFGKNASNLCNASNLDKFAAEVTAAAAERRDAARQLLAALKRVVPVGANRLLTADASIRLIDRLDAKLKPIEVVNRLHLAEIATSLPAMDRSLSSAAGVQTAIEHSSWALFEGLKTIPEGANVLDRLNTGLSDDEYITPLAARLRECATDAARLLIERNPPPPPPPPPQQPPPKETQTGKRTIAKETKQTTSAHLTETLAELQRAAKAHPNADIELTWEIRE